MEYIISDEPEYGYKRKVTVACIHIGLEGFMDKAINLVAVARYYDSSWSPVTIIPPKTVTLRADDNVWVDSSGNIVPEDDPTAVMTEYDFFIAMLNTPVVISDIVEQKIAQSDAIGRFN